LHDAALLFDLGQAVDNLLLLERFDALGQIPAGMGEPGAVEDGKRCFQANGGRNILTVEQAAKRFEGAGAEVAQLIVQSAAIFAPGIFRGGLERRLMAEPIVDRGSVRAGLKGGGGDGASLSQDGDDLGLSRRKSRICNRLEISLRGSKGLRSGEGCEREA
jgi:hypothetical protein